MEFKGTQGKWGYSPLSNFSGTLVSYITSGDNNVAQLRGCSTGQEDEAECNAKLIAAAPDMLESLIEIADKLDGTEMNVNSFEFKLWKIANGAIRNALK